MNAVYDLSRYPASFNFLEFLVAARAAGADHVILDDTRGYRPKKYPEDVARRRVETILVPACALFGMTHSFGAGEGIDPGYHMNVVIEAWRRHGRIAKLKSVLPPAAERYTVTLRHSGRVPERNSNAAAWRAFAARTGARVIEDYDVTPLHLHERAALYAGAEMNFMSIGGPSNVCLFSDYPVTVFMKGYNAAYHASIGWPVGSQLPWLNANQRIVWQDDTLDNLRAAFASPMAAA